jgi:predicted CXXCH cytochrome family protein
MCLECHDPHQAPNERLLKKTIPGLCWSCHDDFAKGEGVRSVHPPMEEGLCLECHDPHASDNERMLKKPVPTVCMDCHEKEMLAEQPAHKNMENCLECHEAHASPKKSLLK